METKFKLRQRVFAPGFRDTFVINNIEWDEVRKKIFYSSSIRCSASYEESELEEVIEPEVFDLEWCYCNGVASPKVNGAQSNILNKYIGKRTKVTIEVL